MSAMWAMSNKKRKASAGAAAAAAAADAPPLVRVRRDANTIADFVGRYASLANGYICQFGVRGTAAGGLVYPSVEHALQASKAADDATRRRIRAAPTAVDAKRIGNKLPLPAGVTPKQWKQRSREIVQALLRDKFKRNKVVAQELVETRGKVLVYDNQWGDTFWGVSKGKGHNHLGRLLEAARTELVSSSDQGLGAWITDQFDLCEQAEADQTTLRLQAIRGGDPTDDPELVLRQGRFYTFGKSSGCDVTLRHGSISRTHATLVLLDDGLVHCLDLRSSFGTKVNGKKLKPLEPKLLRVSDELRFGASSCSYRVVAVEKGLVQRSRADLYAAVMRPAEASEDASATTGGAVDAAVAAAVSSRGGGGSDFGDGCTIFIGNVPDDTTPDHLKEHFAASGRVVRAHLPKDRATGAPRGIAFVTFTTYQEALKAQQLEGSTLPHDKEMKMLAVRLAKPSSKTGGGGGGGGAGHSGDWTCPKCRANVFASKSACYKCSTPRPGTSATTGVNTAPLGGPRKY